jgi:hypothetical protein
MHRFRFVSVRRVSTVRRNVVAAAVLSVVLRLRFVAAPLGDDEGVLLAAARVWSRGGELYRDVWLDRPQGAVVLFRAWSAVAPPSVLRWLSVAFGALLVVSIGGAARAVALWIDVRRPGEPRRADRIATTAAIVAAAWSSSPRLFGFASLPVLIGLALVTAACWSVMEVVARRTGPWAALLAGGCVGAAVTLDLVVAFAAAIVPLGVAAASFVRSSRTTALATLRLVGVGMLVPITLMVAHTMSLGWSVWWRAVVTARLDRVDPQQWLLVVPAGAVAAGVVVGGMTRSSWRAAASALVLVPTAWWFGAQVTRSDEDVVTGSVGRGAVHAESVGVWVEENTSPDERVYALCSGTALYAFADRLPGVPVLTGDDLRRTPTGSTLLVSALASEGRPDVVVRFDMPVDCGSPSLVGVLERHYVEVAVVDGVSVLRSSGG